MPCLSVVYRRSHSHIHEHQDCIETWMFWKQKDRRRSADESDDAAAGGRDSPNEEKVVNVDLESESARKKDLPRIPHDA